MNTKINLLLFVSIFFSRNIVNAQTDVDAFRYSGNSITGTARFTAMSGAFGAVGGDITGLSYNPAGIGIYRSSEFTFTPSIYSSTTTSNFLGNTFEQRKYNFNVGNIGMIYTNKVSKNQDKPGWRSWSFGIGYNRLDNFHTRNYYQGINNANSLLDHFAEQANGTNPDNLDPFYELQAYNTYMINPDGSNLYQGAIPSGKEIQQRDFESRGAIGETVFTFGGNYSDKFYLGATLGLKSLRYIESSTYEELDPDTQIAYFNRFKFQQDLTTRGTGVDLKFGFIFRPNDIVRLGIAIHTPTWYEMHDEFNNKMISKLDTGLVTSFTDEANGTFDYNLTTPFKTIGSVAFVFGKFGLLSADYEFSDYGDSRFNVSGTSFADVNNLIRKKYTGVHTLRLGTEWIYENLSFRAGATLTSSPLDDLYKTSGSDFSSKGLSGGIGYREDGLFFDIGYAYSYSNEFYQPYTLSTQIVPGVKSKVVNHNFTATIGVKF